MPRICSYPGAVTRQASPVPAVEPSSEARAFSLGLLDDLRAWLWELSLDHLDDEALVGEGPLATDGRRMEVLERLGWALAERAEAEERPVPEVIWRLIEAMAGAEHGFEQAIVGAVESIDVPPAPTLPVPFGDAGGLGSWASAQEAREQALEQRLVMAQHLLHQARLVWLPKLADSFVAVMEAAVSDTTAAQGMASFVTAAKELHEFPAPA